MLWDCRYNQLADIQNYNQTTNHFVRTEKINPLNDPCYNSHQKFEFKLLQKIYIQIKRP